MSPKQQVFMSVSKTLAILVACVTLFGVVWSASADRTEMDCSIQELQETDDDHETRLRAVETVVTQTHVIVQRIDARMTTAHP